MSRPLYKATIIIWSKVDPLRMELSELARDAEVGGSYVASMKSDRVEDPMADEHAPDPEFFGFEDDDDDS